MFGLSKKERDEKIVAEMKTKYRRLSMKETAHRVHNGLPGLSGDDFDQWLVSAVNDLAYEFIPKYKLEDEEFQRLARLAIYGEE